MKNFLSKTLIVFLVVFLALPVSAFNKSDSNADLAEVISQYIKIDSNDMIYFDKEAAKLDNQTNEVFEIGEIAESLGNPSARFVYYGNWCGPNYGGGTPIDDLDGYCRTHDLCYRKNSNKAHRCKCDETLVNTIVKNWGSYTGTKRKKAIGIVSYFNSAAAGCRPYD